MIFPTRAVLLATWAFNIVPPRMIPISATGLLQSKNKRFIFSPSLQVYGPGISDGSERSLIGPCENPGRQCCYLEFLILSLEGLDTGGLRLVIRLLYSFYAGQMT